MAIILFYFLTHLNTISKQRSFETTSTSVNIMFKNN